MNTTPSDNILELRRLSAKLCEKNYEDDYKKIMVEVKKIIESGKEEVIHQKTLKEKVKYYEIMYANITNLIQK